MFYSPFNIKESTHELRALLSLMLLLLSFLPFFFKCWMYNPHMQSNDRLKNRKIVKISSYAVYATRKSILFFYIMEDHSNITEKPRYSENIYSGRTKNLVLTKLLCN